MKMVINPNSRRKARPALIVCLLFAFLLAGCERKPPATYNTLTPPSPIKAPHYRDLARIFSEHDYSMDTVDEGVPPLVLKRLPNDLHLIKSVNRKKNLFFKTILPMALLVNEELLWQREQAENIIRRYDLDGALNIHQHEQLLKIREQFRVKGDPLHNWNARQELLRRVDSLPVSLILAQAANESGYGTSRFARQANNIFGEWTFTPGTGLIPEGRPPGATYEVRLFRSLYDSVRSYAMNINTHKAYRGLRKKRHELRLAADEPTGMTLAGELLNYSTRREEYVSEIRAMIRVNGLDDLNSVTLRSPEDESVATEELPASFRETREAASRSSSAR